MPALRRRLEQPWRSRRRHLPSLMEELVEEILLRLPPEEPASLVRAALVCKPWRCVISSPRFQRRFLELHRTAPMLGFICNHSHVFSRSSFVRTSASSPLPPQCNNTSRSWSALDARHGRVLLRLGGRLTVAARVLVVWDPITDEQQELPVLPRPTVSCTAAVLCGATATATGAGCDHHGCHRGPFKVVFVGTERWNMFICTYSSDVDKWSEPISIQHPNYDYRIFGGYSPSVLLANELYFGIPTTNAALKYDVELHGKSWIQLPSIDYNSQSSVLITTDDGGLGLVRLKHGILCIWLRMDTHEAEDGLGIVFVTVNKALYTVDLETCMVKKQTCMLKKEVRNGGEIETVFPNMHFYSPSIMALLGS